MAAISANREALSGRRFQWSVCRCRVTPWSAARRHSSPIRVVNSVRARSSLQWFSGLRWMAKIASRAPHSRILASTSSIAATLAR